MMKYATEEERNAARRAAKAAAERRRRAAMSPKQLMAIADAQRKRRANMTPEQKQILRAKDAALKREKLLALISEEEHEIKSINEDRPIRTYNRASKKLSEMRKANAENASKRLANMTPEQREILRAKDAALKREKRLALISEEEHEIEAINEDGHTRSPNRASKKLAEMRKANTECARKRLANMTPEQRDILRAKNAVYQRQRLSARSFQRGRAGEEREKMIAAYFERKRRRLDAMSEEERNKRRAAENLKIRERSAIRKIKEKLENNTTAQRIQRIIRMTRLTENKPRYESALKFIKDSLLEIGNLHIEIGDLKQQLKQTVSEAITNVINYERMRKQTAAVGFRSLTYVQISLPLEPDVIQYQLSSMENETDPLLLQSVEGGKPGRLCPAGESGKKDIQFRQIDDVPSEIFEVCVHDSSAVREETSDQLNKSKKFGCSICSKKFRTSLGLTIHLKDHSAAASSESNKCTVCRKEFDDYNLMTTHYLQAHSSEFSSVPNELETEETDEEMDRFLYEIDYLNSRKCLVCFQTIDKLRFGLPTYSNHIISDHSDNQELLKHFTYICSRCDKPHAMMRSLESHWTTFCYEKWKKENENSSVIVCKNCGMKFSNENKLSTHVSRFHTETREKEVVCERCGNQFKNANRLHDHIALVHEGKYKFTCEHCGKQFKTSGALKTHTKNVHLGEKHYVCKFCSKRFSNGANLEYHLNTHTGEKPYKCKSCDKSFGARSSLTAHEGVHEGFSCKLCGDSFPNYFDLRHHKRHNHNSRDRDVGESGIIEKPLQNHKNCDICGKSFKSFQCVYSHKRIVHGNKNYVCDICGKAYKTSSLLNSHKISHDDLNRFGCSLCGQKFRYMTYFYQHRKVAHTTENARLIKLISDKNLSSSVTLHKSTSLSNPKSEATIQQPVSEQLSNAMQTLNKTAEANNVPQIINSEECKDTNCNLETGGAYFSPQLEDYSSDTEFVNEDNGDDNDLPQFDIAELRKVDVENETFLSVSENEQDSRLPKQTIVEAATNLQSVSSSAFIDFSRANVPFGLSDLLHDESKTEVTKPKLVSGDKIIDINQHELEVFVEDSEDASFLTKLSDHDFVKLKTETVAASDMEEDDENLSNLLCFSASISDDENEPQTKNQEINLDRKCVNKGADLPQNISSPRLIVKLTRLLEYQCVPCDKTIFAISERQIRQHSRTHRTDISKNTFRRLKGFYRHDKNVHDKKGKKPAAQNKSEEEHQPKKKKKKKKESDKKEGNTGIFDCHYCEKKSLMSKKMIVHCSEEHPGKEPFKCKICPKMYLNVNSLDSHHRRHKLKERFGDPNAKKEYLCEECGKAFYTPESVRSHILRVHEKLKNRNIKKFPCDICSKLIRKSELENHKRRHLGIKPHLCDQCGKSFVTNRELKDHVDTVHRKMTRKSKNREKTSTTHPFACTLCPYVFKKESALTSHLNLHDPQRKHSCDECGLRYKFYANVLLHKEYKHKKKGKRCVKVTHTEV